MAVNCQELTKEMKFQDEFVLAHGDWMFYIERLQLYLSLYDIEPIYHVKVLLDSVGPETFKLISSLTSSLNVLTLSFDEIVCLVQDHLNNIPRYMADRVTFYNRRQKSTESVASYIFALEQLANVCNFGGKVLDALRDQLVTGLRDQEAQDILMSKMVGSLTFKDACKVALSAENKTKLQPRPKPRTKTTKSETTSKNAGRKPKGKAAGNHAGSKLSSTNKNHLSRCNNVKSVYSDTKTSDINTVNKCTARCYCCGRLSHKRSHCWYRNCKCFCCGLKGHVRAVCYFNTRSIGKVTPKKSSKGSKTERPTTAKKPKKMSPTLKKSHVQTSENITSIKCSTSSPELCTKSKSLTSSKRGLIKSKPVKKALQTNVSHRKGKLTNCLANANTSGNCNGVNTNIRNIGNKTINASSSSNSFHDNCNESTNTRLLNSCKIDGVEFQYVVESSQDETIFPVKWFKENFPRKVFFRMSPLTEIVYRNTVIKPVGFVEFQVELNGIYKHLTALIAPGRVPFIVGREWLKACHLDLNCTNN